jgi:hypothetical protein
MNDSLIWLPAALRAAGLAVHEIDGWRYRGHWDDGPFEPLAVMFHHDGSPPGDSPGALAWLISGFQSSIDSNYDAQCWVDRRGTWHIVAAGRAQHAGAGPGWGSIPAEQGNRYSFGVETDHTTGEAWPSAQYASIRTGMAAICKRQGWDPARCVVGHKEYAPGRKDDPNPVDMAQFRREVAAEMEDDVTAAEVWAQRLAVPPEFNPEISATSFTATELAYGANVWGGRNAKTLAVLAGQVTALATAVQHLSGGAVDMAAVEAAAEKGAADALAHLRIVTDEPPAP